MLFYMHVRTTMPFSLSYREYKSCDVVPTTIKTNISLIHRYRNIVTFLWFVFKKGNVSIVRVPPMFSNAYTKTRRQGGYICPMLCQQYSIKLIISVGINTACISRCHTTTPYARPDFSAPFSQVFCQLLSEDERWYWQLDFGSELTMVSLLCLKMLCFISF
jgi:hypothetical protein